MAIEPMLWAVAALLCVAIMGAAFGWRPWASRPIYAMCLGLSLAMLWLATSALLDSGLRMGSIVLPVGLPWIGARFRIDALSAFFLVIVDLGTAAASLYAFGYGEHEEAPGRVLAFYPAFLAGMNLVLLADDAFSFLVAWEFMSLASWALVVSHHRDAENVRAGYVYIVMASFGTLALLLAFGLLAGAAGSYGFGEIRAQPMVPWVSSLVLLLALVGTGSKAGLVPLHVWLPLAHPAAPSHVSALMSGVMTKVAIYGFVRIVLDLAGPPAWWWGLPVLAIASITAVLGILTAVMQRDLKRLLAYSTIENVGIVFIGLGLALAFKANGMMAAAALAATAALLHALNHALFKSLLFLGAGCVLVGTGIRDIERLGGLIHSMPRTTIAFLGGCLAISALPPLNGFVSEWLMFQAVLLSPDLPQWGLKLAVPACGAMLALAAALSANCFVRVFGVTFLGRPRSNAAAKATEVDIFSIGAMLVLLALCVVTGVLPGYVIDALAPAIDLVAGIHMPPQTTDPWLSIVPIEDSRSSYDGLLILAFIVSSTVIVVEAIHRLASRSVRRAPAWDCGFPQSDPATQYTADSFAQPVRRVFADVFAAQDVVDMPLPGDARPARLVVRLRDLAWEWLYAPLAWGVERTAGLLNHLQFLTIRSYLSLVFAALVTLLMVVAIWP